MSRHYYKYVLEVRVDGKLIRLVDVFDRYKHAEMAAKEISLKPNESINIACVEYDACMNKLPTKLY